MNRMARPLRPQPDIGPAGIDKAPTCIPLDRKRLQAALDRRCADDGIACRWDARVVATTASTNSDLLREARGGHAFTTPVALAAENQTAGRGRLGRAWHSSAGASLTVSYAFGVTRRLGELEGVSLVCGLAVRDALARHGVRTALKWPNDVLIDGRKLAGILVEAHALPARTIVIVGVGVNVSPSEFGGSGGVAHDFEPIVQPIVQPIDLRSAGCPLEDRHVLAADLGVAIERRLARFSDEGFSVFASEWNAVDAFRDRHVTLGTTIDDATSGVERGVDASGRLLIEIDGEVRRFIAGDVSLRAVAEA